MGTKIFTELEFKKFLETNKYNQKDKNFFDIANYLSIKFLDGIDNFEYPKNDLYVEIENFWNFSENKLAYNYFLEFLEDHEWLQAHLFDIAENYYTDLFSLTNKNFENDVEIRINDIEYKLQTILSFNNSLKKDILNLSDLFKDFEKKLDLSAQKDIDLFKMNELFLNLKQLNYTSNIKANSEYKNTINIVQDLKFSFSEAKELFFQTLTYQQKKIFNKIGSNSNIKINENILQNSFILKKINEYKEDIDLTFSAMKKL